MIKPIATLLLLAAALLPAQDRWFEIKLDGQPTGFFHMHRADAKTLEEMVFVANRLGNRVEIKVRTETAEDAEGRFLSAHGETSMSAQTVAYDALLRGGAIELKTTAGGRSYTTSIPATSPILGPRGVESLTRHSLTRVGDSVSFLQFNGNAGKIAKVTRTVVALQPLQVEEQSDLQPGKTPLTLDQEGVLVATATDFPFGHATTTLANRDAALSAANGSELPAETFSKTLARSNIRLPDPRSLDHVLIRLTHHRPDLGWPPLDGPNQKLIAKTADMATIDVTNQVSELQPIDEPAYLKPNSILQSDDPEIVRLARQITAAQPDDRLKAARLLQDWTAANLKLDLGIALAPASEVVRNRGGTCIAYAVLLASLERAAGIPSRVVMGFVYVDGIWGGHAWTEIAANNRWIPFDAAVYQPGPADPARFRFGAYTMEDNMAQANAAGLQLYGNIDMTVLEYNHTRVPAGAPPFTVAANTYTNPWLGVSVEAPAGARFTRLDAVYPDSTIFELHKDGSSVNVSIEPAARKTSSPAEITIPDGQSVWVLTAKGDHAAELLQQVRGSWKWLRPRH